MKIEPPSERVCQRVGVAAGDGVDEADGSAAGDGVDKADGSADGGAMSALTLQSARSRSSRGWMDCSWRTMSSSCCRSTALAAGPTSLRMTLTSCASLITRRQAALTSALAAPGTLWPPAGDGVVDGALPGGGEKSGLRMSSRPTARTPTTTPTTKVRAAIHQRDRRWTAPASSSARCCESVPATWRLLGWSD